MNTVSMISAGENAAEQSTGHHAGRLHTDARPIPPLDGAPKILYDWFLRVT